MFILTHFRNQQQSRAEATTGAASEPLVEPIGDARYYGLSSLFTLNAKHRPNVHTHMGALEADCDKHRNMLRAFFLFPAWFGPAGSEVRREGVGILGHDFWCDRFFFVGSVVSYVCFVNEKCCSSGGPGCHVRIIRLINFIGSAFEAWRSRRFISVRSILGETRASYRIIRCAFVILSSILLNCNRNLGLEGNP